VGAEPSLEALPGGPTPTSPTSGSSRKPEKIPMALLPPPTQAATSRGRCPTRSITWRRASRPMTLWKCRTISG
jgi:hypothetical protein